VNRITTKVMALGVDQGSARRAASHSERLRRRIAETTPSLVAKMCSDDVRRALASASARALV
jgi:prephenate dehydrogenase